MLRCDETASADDEDALIIQCEQCKTRFKVGDEKLQGGGIRVRCSKCNHVFHAKADPQQPTAPLGQPAGITGLFASVNASVPPSPSGGGFGSAQNRSGIFRAPTQAGMPAASSPPAPIADPFANLGPRQPTPGAASPFSSLTPRASEPPAPPADPFQGLAAKQGAPSASPFAAMSEPPRAAGPVTAMSMPAFSLSSMPPAPPPPPGPPPAPSGSPFSPSFSAPPPDPFAASPSEVMTSPGILARAQTPAPATESLSFGDLQSASSGVPRADPFAGVASAPPAPVSDPFGAAAALQTDGGPFGPGAQLATDPFSTGAPSPNAGAGVSDPFAGLSAAQSGAPSMPPPPPDDAGDADPFAGIEADVESRALFDMPTQPPKPAQSTAPTSAATEPPRAAAVTHVPTHASATGADMKRLKRLELAQRTREIVWGVAQVVILSVLVIVAVVIGRGGSFEALLRGDVRAGLGGASSTGALAVSDVRVARRTHKSGAPLVVVTGTVSNRGLESVPGARVDVRFEGDARTASGWAWSDVDALEVEDVSEAPAAAQLSARAPRSSALAPGERAPFVVVGPAPAEGARAVIDVIAVKPPPPPVPAAVVEPVPEQPAPDVAPKAPKGKAAPKPKAPAKP